MMERRVDEWKAECALPDISVLEMAGRHYVKPEIEPYAGLAMPGASRGGRTGRGGGGDGRFGGYIDSRGEPPSWLAARLRSALLDIAANWQDRLETEADARPFRVFAWLKEIHATDSQVVCEFGDSVGFYDKTYERKMEGRMPSFHIIGHELSAAPGGGLIGRPDGGRVAGAAPGDSATGRSFSWECWLECDYFYENMDELDAAAIAKLLRKGAIRSETKAGGAPDACFALPRDRVWVVRPLPRA